MMPLAFVLGFGTLLCLIKEQLYYTALPYREQSENGTPNAKSVSERIWHMSHPVRPNPASTLHTLVSQALVLQEKVKLFHGYNAW